MASRCGCAGTCACVLSTDSSLVLSGNGSAQSPWLLRVVPNCASTMACVGASVDAPLAVNNGRLSVGISGDDDQVLTTGTDGGLYVPGCVAGAVAIDDTDTVALSGSGQTGNPLTADWLGADVNNTPNTGVNLSGDGTPGAPLHAAWAGVNVAMSNPEMRVTGNGTPTSPLTFAWGGLPWNRFLATGEAVANGQSGSVVANWQAAGGNGTVIATVAGTNNGWFNIARSGSYLIICRQRFLLTASQTTMGGYFQMTVETAPQGVNFFDSVVSTYGAGWVDLNYVEQITLTAGQNIQLSLNNYTGSNAGSGTAYTTFLRISD